MLIFYGITNDILVTIATCTKDPEMGGGSRSPLKNYKNTARREQSSHTPGGSHQRLLHFQRKDKIVKDFIILTQVVAEKIFIGEKEK